MIQNPAWFSLRVKSCLKELFVQEGACRCIAGKSLHSQLFASTKGTTNVHAKVNVLDVAVKVAISNDVSIPIDERVASGKT